MNYYIGQALGLMGTLCCLILPFLKKKWQMLALTAIINVFCALNLVLIGQVGSVILIYVVAVVQTIVALWHLKKDTQVTKAENLLFLALSVLDFITVLETGRTSLPPGPHAISLIFFFLPNAGTQLTVLEDASESTIISSAGPSASPPCLLFW